MKILVTGGAGYVGSVLVPRLLSLGHDVVVLDTFFFGDRLPNDPRLTKIKGDIRSAEAVKLAVTGADIVLHLACISNDPSAELDAALTKSINLDAFEPLVIAAKEAGVKRFVYCSSSSVYGISDAPKVTEDHPLVPITLYNRFKAECEPILWRHQSDDFVCVTIRPSTVCGYSPRQRLDLSVNILTNLAVNKGVITVFGGKQLRPNLHIDDMVDAYVCVINAPAEKIAGQTFNIGERNYSISQLAELVRAIVEDELRTNISIEQAASVDGRSYQVNSDKIAEVLGFTPKRRVQDAVRDLVAAFRDGRLPNSLTDDVYYNVKRMRALNVGGVYNDAPPEVFDPVKGHLSEIDALHR